MTLPHGNALNYLVMLAFCMLVSFAGENTQAREYKPADFGPESFTGIKIPSIEISDEITDVFVPCQSIIEITGRPSNYSCITRFIYEHRLLLRAVMNAIPRQSFVAATVDGEAVRVLMNFTVIFVCRDGYCTTDTTRNHMYHHENYGLDYVAPQPILADDKWYDGFGMKLYWSRELKKNINKDITFRDRAASRINIFVPYLPSYTITADIGSDGVVTDYSVFDTIKASMQSESIRAAATIANVDFIPGFYNNEPVAMRLYEWGMTKSSGPVSFPIPVPPNPHRDPVTGT